MVSRLRLCKATQSARASASATVPIASTSTASYSPKIKVDVIGSKPSASPKGFGRSPTIAFPGAVKTLTPSVFDVMGALMCVVSLSSYDAPMIVCLLQSCHHARAGTKRRSLRSPRAVRRENVILGRDSRMASKAASDDAGRIGLERVRPGIIVKHGVCPSLRAREFLGVLLDEENVL